MSAKHRVLAFLLAWPTIVYSQTWSWDENSTMFNPSGLAIESANFQFQFLDWDGDGLLDLLLNQDDHLQSYEQVEAGTMVWQETSIPLPEQPGQRWAFTWIPANFQAVDLDRDGDWDIVSDSARVYFNTGSNAEPAWQVDQEYLPGRITPPVIGADSLDCQLNFRFLDFDDDGDLDFLADCVNAARRWAPAGTRFLKYDRDLDRWQPNSFLESRPFPDASYGHISLNDFDLDGDLDVFTSLFSIFGSDQRTLTGVELHFNMGDNDAPVWTKLPEAVWPDKEYYSYHPYLNLGHFANLDGEHGDDFAFNTPNRHLKLILNRTTPHGIMFVDPEISLGRFNVEADAIPFLPPDSTFPALIVSENYVDWYFASDMFSAYHGRLCAFDSLGALDHNYAHEPFKTWFVGPLLNRDEVKSFYHISFAHLPGNGQLGLAISYLFETNFEIQGYQVEFYTQTPGQDSGWQQDTTFLADFDVPPGRFNKPTLADIDGDSRLDLLIRKDETFTAFTNFGSIAAPDWLETPELLAGIDRLQRFHLALEDMDGDGDLDIVFGNEDGTLSLFENLGSGGGNRWREHPGAFSGIDVGQNAAPVVGDIDNDRKLDLIIGNQLGFLYAYESPTVVSVGSPATAAPEMFSLSQNYPNPFNPETRIRFDLPASGPVKLVVFNTRGQAVRTLVSGILPAGAHEAQWDGKDDQGRPMASGVYFYRIGVGENTSTHKALLMR